MDANEAKETLDTATNPENLSDNYAEFSRIWDLGVEAGDDTANAALDNGADTAVEAVEALGLPLGGPEMDALEYHYTILTYRSLL